MAAPSTIATLERALNPNSQVQWRRDAASVWSLCDGDPLRLAEWCLKRLEMGLCQEPSEEAYLRQLMGSCHAVVDVEVRPVIKAMGRSENALRQAAMQAERERVAAWEERKAAIIKRDQERRGGPVRQQLERQMAKPTAPVQPKRELLQDRMRKAWWRQYQQQRRRTAVGAMA